MEQHTNNDISTTRIALKYGTFIGLGSVAFSIALWAGNLEEVQYLQLLDTLIWVAGLVLAMQEYKKYQGGFMKFGEGFGIGFMGCTIAGIIEGFYAQIHFRFLNLETLPKIKEELIKQWEKGGMTDEQMEALRPWAEWFATPNFMFLGAVIGGMLSGLIFGLIISAIMQKENDNPFAKS